MKEAERGPILDGEMAEKNLQEKHGKELLSTVLWFITRCCSFLFFYTKIFSSLLYIDHTSFQKPFKIAYRFLMSPLLNQ